MELWVWQWSFFVDFNLATVVYFPNGDILRFRIISSGATVASTLMEITTSTCVDPSESPGTQFLCLVDLDLPARLQIL